MGRWGGGFLVLVRFVLACGGGCPLFSFLFFFRSGTSLLRTSALLGKVYADALFIYWYSYCGRREVAANSPAESI